VYVQEKYFLTSRHTVLEGFQGRTEFGLNIPTDFSELALMVFAGTYLSITLRLESSGKFGVRTVLRDNLCAACGVGFPHLWSPEALPFDPVSG
jgi:hypothetical protein